MWHIPYKRYHKQLYYNGVLTYDGTGYDDTEGVFYCDGTGKAYDLDGTFLYESEFKDGTRCGTGRMYYPDGTLLYEGGYQNGKRNGMGQYRLDGTLEYEGMFSNSESCPKDRQEAAGPSGVAQDKESEENVPCSKDIQPDRSALAELQELIGLDSLKREVSKHINLYKINERRKARGMQVPSISMHMVFTGNPGTGKTTVARLLARIYHEIGLLPREQVAEVKRDGPVAAYVGQTAIKTKAVIERALGGVLFIDEAYTQPRRHQYGLRAGGHRHPA